MGGDQLLQRLAAIESRLGVIESRLGVIESRLADVNAPIGDVERTVEVNRNVDAIAGTLEEDARSDMGAAYVLYALGIGAVMLPGALLAAHVLDLTEAMLSLHLPGFTFLEAAESMSSPGVWAFLFVVGVGFTAAVLFVQAERHRRAARASRVRARELQMLPDYLARLSELNAEALLITLAARLFSGPSDRIDIATDPEWPGFSEVLESLEVSMGTPLHSDQA